MQEKVQTKRVGEGEGNGSPKAKSKPSAAPAVLGKAPPPPPPSSRATSSRVRGVSVDPQNKYAQAGADAKKLVQDPALRSDYEHLNTETVPVLKELLKIERIDKIDTPTGKSV